MSVPNGISLLKYYSTGTNITVFPNRIKGIECIVISSGTDTNALVITNSFKDNLLGETHFMLTLMYMYFVKMKLMSDGFNLCMLIFCLASVLLTGSRIKCNFCICFEIIKICLQFSHLSDFVYLFV